MQASPSWPLTIAGACGTGGAFVERAIGMPAETVYERPQTFVWIEGRGNTVA
jgi:hypothetical protein